MLLEVQEGREDRPQADEGRQPDPGQPVDKRPNGPVRVDLAASAAAGAVPDGNLQGAVFWGRNDAGGGGGRSLPNIRSAAVPPGGSSS